MTTIRLACLLCDRDDYDGIERVPSDWLDVDEVQSYEAAMDEADLTYPTFGWWTHVGVCPECQQIRFVPTDPALAELR